MSLPPSSCAARNPRCSLVVVLLGFAPAARAQFFTPLTASPASPVVGEQVTFSAQWGSECSQTFSFTVDGQAPPSGSTVTVHSFPAPATVSLQTTFETGRQPHRAGDAV